MSAPTVKAIAITAFVNTDTRQVFKLSRDPGHPNEYVNVIDMGAKMERAYVHFAEAMRDPKMEIKTIKILKHAEQTN